MNGPSSHYREAEKLLARADTARADVAPVLVAMAQVHATLATAAAWSDAALLLLRQPQRMDAGDLT